MPVVLPMSVLVVEDDPLVRLFVIQALTDEGYLAEPAASAEEARALLERRRYDVLMTDIVLAHGQDGFALAAWAVRRRPDLRVVYSTGLVEPLHHRMTAPGAILQKPFGVNRLLGAIDAMAERAGAAAAA